MASTVSVLTFTTLAEETTPPKLDRPGHADDRRPASVRRSDRLNGAAKASDLMGMTVRNYQGDKLAKVEDLAVDVESGRVVQIILSMGGIIGVGETLTAVPPGALHHDVAQKVLHLNVDKEKLKSAPAFDMDKWSESSDSAHLGAVYQLYGEEAAFRFVRKGETATDGFLDDGATRGAQEAGTKGKWIHEWQATIPASRLGQVRKASKLIGTEVQNLQLESLGRVDNILVDLTSGRMVAIVISSGGFLGIGDELSAVPPSVLGFTTDRSMLQLDISKEALARAPHFSAKQWPDFAQAGYVGEVYHAHRVEPYFSTAVTPGANKTPLTGRGRDGREITPSDQGNKVTTGADNTARNERDRHGSELTPLDQGSSKADVSTTARIRKEIIAGDNMSVNARNVKIITLNGRVTLRGPVNSVEEKRLIGEISNRIARLENVDNQLEVTLVSLPKSR